MVPKSHPESENPFVEWRLSFSLVEKEILLDLPIFWRKAYMIAKSSYTSLYDKHHKTQTKYLYPNEEKPAYEEKPLKSYHIKTVLMWLYEEQPDFDQCDIIGLLQLIFNRLLKAFTELNLPNYFIPKQNILNTNSMIKPKKMNDLQMMLKAFSMKLKDSSECSHNNDVKMRYFDITISKEVFPMLTNVPDSYCMGDAKTRYLMSTFKDCMNSFLTFLHSLFDEGKSFAFSNVGTIKASFYRLITIKIGLAGLKKKMELLSNSF